MFTQQNRSVRANDEGWGNDFYLSTKLGDQSMKRIYWISAIAVAVFALTLAAHADEMRTWTSSAGQQMEAEMLKISEDGKIVTLRRKDGREGEVALDKLSNADKSYIAKWKKSTPKPETPSIDLKEELKKSDLDNLHDFAFYVNAELKDKFLKGDIFDKEQVQTVINTERAKIAKKTFVAEYGYSTSVANVQGNKSRFTIAIPMGAAHADGIQAQRGQENRRFTMTFPQPSYSRKAKAVVTFSVPNVKGNIIYLQVTDKYFVVYPRIPGSFSGISLEVNGNTDSIKELIRNKDDYQAKIHFKIRYGVNNRIGRGPSKLIFNPDGKGEPVVEIQKIEIIKVK